MRKRGAGNDDEFCIHNEQGSVGREEEYPSGGNREAQKWPYVSDWLGTIIHQSNYNRVGTI